MRDAEQITWSGWHPMPVCKTCRAHILTCPGRREGEAFPHWRCPVCKQAWQCQRRVAWLWEGPLD